MKLFFTSCIILLLIGCSTEEQESINALPTAIGTIKDTVPPISLSRKFKGNTLRITTSGEPPMIVSLHKKDKQVYHDFLSHSGTVDIDILPYRKAWGQYVVRLEDGLDRDTGIAVQIDKYAPQKRQRRGAASSKKSYRPKYISGRYKEIKTVSIMHTTETKIICSECGEYETIYFNTYKTSHFTADSDTRRHYRSFVPTARAACRRICEAKR